MTYDAEKVKLGRKPVTMCGIVADFCSLTHGIAPCTATETGDNKCFNTRSSCNDTDNYTKDSKEYILSQPRDNLPKIMIEDSFDLLIETSYNISSSSYSGNSLDVSGEDLTPQDVLVSPDGFTAFVLGNSGNKIYEYNLSIKNDISSGIYNSVFFVVTGSLPFSMTMAASGTKLYVLDTGTDLVYQYTLGTGWDLSTIAYDSKSFSIASEDTNSVGIYVTEDGKKLFFLGAGNEKVYQYSIATAYDISTAVYASKFADVSGLDGTLRGLSMSSSGTRLFVVGQSTDKIYSFTMSALFDASTASYDTLFFSVLPEDTAPYGFSFNDGGSIFYLAGNAGNKIYQYENPSSWSAPLRSGIMPLISGDITKAPTSTTAGTGLGKRAVVTVKFKDMSHHDRGIDPYIAGRTYDATAQGTFWGKWLARNTYYEGRTLKVYHGYIAEPFSWSDFEVQEYDITEIKRDKKNMVTLIAKDALIRTYADKAEYPPASDGVLLSDITSGGTSATLSPAGIGDTDYPASGYISIADEAIYYTRSSDTLTLIRGQWGTSATEHSAGSVVQIAPAWTATETDNVLDMLEELLVTGAGMPSSYIPTAEWDVQRELWMSSSLVKGILMKPEAIEDIIEELSEVFMFDIWWDAVTQEIKVKALSPELGSDTINTLSEDVNIIQESLKIDKNPEDRFTEVQVYFNKIDYSGDDKEENFRNRQVAADATRASEDLYDGNAIKTMFSRWFDSGAHALQLTGRTLKRFSDTPEYVTFRLDNKDHGKLELAGRIELDSWQFQDVTGATTAKKFQVLEIKEIDAGHQFEVKCLTSTFDGRYFFIAPDATPDYTSATDDQKLSYGFISQADGFFSNGDEAYKII